MNSSILKRLTAITIALLVAVCFSACGSKDTKEPEPEQEEVTEETLEEEDEDYENYEDENYVEEEEEDDGTTTAQSSKPVLGGWEVYGDTEAVELPVAWARLIT